MNHGKKNLSDLIELEIAFENNPTVEVYDEIYKLRNELGYTKNQISILVNQYRKK